eukprot:CAMPEP_0172393558 /NCGR_PEP_ID=MMETSP1061-20121228/10795_1 /TAXON_ID=37318 /ORGANISM="Pseudo-nitzschia pungens, Strain cf. pungens" /LENGTH=838 /DNA_ID=CAMNT_0013124663 /DNA_START=451 /DNA_END=2967 /DNA_ORIENTATION=+
MKDVKKILNTTRHPVIASSEDREHSYDDKYALVETVTNLFVASATNVLNQLGVPVDTVINWVRNDKRSVVLRFTMDQKINYWKQTRRKGQNLLDNSYDHHFKVATPYKLELLKGGGGSGVGEGTLLLRHREDMQKVIVIIGGKDRVPPPPFPNDSESIELDITWIAQQLASQNVGGVESSPFSIDRLSKECKTPRRNPDVEKAREFLEQFDSWVLHLTDLVTRHDPKVRSAVTNHSDRIFSPVLPLFENHKVIDQETIGTFIEKHDDSLKEGITSIANLYKDKEIVTDKEAAMLLLVEQLMALKNWWNFSVNHVEEMLYKQLEDAIGKRVTPKDFQDFIDFHVKHIFKDDYVPKPFAYAIRRGKNYPDGMLSLVGGPHNKLVTEHFQTTVRRIPVDDSRPPMFIPLSPATSVEIQGDRFLHGWLLSQWAGPNMSRKKFLVARAHQFSSFLLVIGQMRGPNHFVPKNAIILQNKDEVMIQLSTSVLPSAKEFKDSIGSLSPEQQDFAKVFRKMQLESSVLGICVIQIKPQLERLLNLPSGALTKEIRLTQDLMNLFVDYQIPSDLLSYDGVPNATISEKVKSVKEYVKAVAKVIDDLKEKQLKDEKMKKKMRKTLNDEHSFQQSSDYSNVFETTSARFETLSFEPSSCPHDSSASGSYDHKWSADRGDGKFSHGIKKTENADIDFTQIPNVLDKRIEKEDEDGALKSTIITPTPHFWRSRQPNLLSDPVESMIDSSNVQDETNKAIDLLTAISRSGSLPVHASELHIVIGMTHCFAKQIMETIIQDNVNPIKKIEQSLLIIASVIHNEPNISNLGPNDMEKHDTVVEPEIVLTKEDATE